MKFAVRLNLGLVLAALMILPGVLTGEAQSTKPVSQSAAKKPPAPANANADLIRLAQAGMSEEILLATVAKTDKSRYNTSADALLKLKEAGVSQRVIAAILGVSSVSSTSSAKSEPAVSASRDEQTKHVSVSMAQTPTRSADGSREAGIYLVQGNQFIQLEPSVYSGGKTGNKFGNAITTLIPKAEKVVVRSAKANQRLEEATPVFQFYFENRSAGLSNTGGVMGGFMNGASSPNEFVLIRMKVSKDEREVVIGKSWAFSDRTGVQSKDTIDFSMEKLRTGVYRVTPKQPLAAGEYCFFYAAGIALTAQSGMGKLFDFGVDR